MAQHLAYRDTGGNLAMIVVSNRDVFAMSYLLRVFRCLDLTFSMAYYMWKYPLKSTLSVLAGARFSGYLSNWR